MKDQNFKKGSKYTVSKHCRKNCFRRRLMDLGLTPGIEFLIVKETPFGDPVIINVRGYEISVRKKDLKKII